KRALWDEVIEEEDLGRARRDHGRQIPGRGFGRKRDALDGEPAGAYTGADDVAIRIAASAHEQPRACACVAHKRDSVDRPEPALVGVESRDLYEGRPVAERLAQRPRLRRRQRLQETLGDAVREDGRIDTDRGHLRAHETRDRRDRRGELQRAPRAAGASDRRRRGGGRSGRDRRARRPSRSCAWRDRRRTNSGRGLRRRRGPRHTWKSTDNGTRSMTPLQRIREDPQKVRDMLAARGFDAPLDRILELDRKASDLRAQVESLNAERNK